MAGSAFDIFNITDYWFGEFLADLLTLTRPVLKSSEKVLMRKLSP